MNPYCRDQQIIIVVEYDGKFHGINGFSGYGKNWLRSWMCWDGLEATGVARPLIKHNP